MNAAHIYELWHGGNFYKWSVWDLSWNEAIDKENS